MQLLACTIPSTEATPHFPGRNPAIRVLIPPLESTIPVFQDLVRALFANPLYGLASVSVMAFFEIPHAPSPYMATDTGTDSSSDMGTESSPETPAAAQADPAVDTDVDSFTDSSSDEEAVPGPIQPNLPAVSLDYDGHSIRTVARHVGLAVPSWYYGPDADPDTATPLVQWVPRAELDDGRSADPNTLTRIPNHTEGVEEDTDSKAEESSVGFQDPLHNRDYVPDRSCHHIFVLASRRETRRVDFLAGYLKMPSARDLLCFLQTDGTHPISLVLAVRTRILAMQPFGF